jgi:hypothetical protein
MPENWAQLRGKPAQQNNNDTMATSKHIKPHTHFYVGTHDQMFVIHQIAQTVVLCQYLGAHHQTRAGGFARRGQTKGNLLVGIVSLEFFVVLSHTHRHTQEIENDWQGKTRNRNPENQF